MSKTIISVKNLSKQYRLGQVGTGTLRHDINRVWHKVRGKEDPYLKIGTKNDRTKKSESEFVWALRDICFDVKEGEVIGIIGRNGAGKSTLLKILSKITSPTVGEIGVNGRIASLLEVGTGFHPDLTGRENIYLNGAILGMRKWEINNKFDEIVDFAGVRAYVDTPVKRYSSGMKVRLGFAVAAFLENEILVVDEVLAVGDSEFQKKCIARMLELTKDGRTVLFVSHNLSNIRSLCQRGIVLENGQKVFDDKVTLALEKYSNQNVYFNQEIDLKAINRISYSGGIKFEAVSFSKKNFDFGETIDFEITIRCYNEELIGKEVDLGFAVTDLDGNRLLHVSNRFIHKPVVIQTEEFVVKVSIANNLRGGVYSIELYAAINDTVQDWVRELVFFEILDGNPYGYADSTVIYGKFMGDFNLEVISNGNS